jgi:hypothetical protein
MKTPNKKDGGKNEDTRQNMVLSTERRTTHYQFIQNSSNTALNPTHSQIRQRSQVITTT